MTLLIDENIDKPIVDVFRDLELKIISISDISPGITDEEVLNIANRESAVILTSDKDFGELIFRKRLINKGVVLVRLHGISADEKKSIVREFVNKYLDKIENSFCVISKNNIRIRSRLN